MKLASKRDTRDVAASLDKQIAISTRRNQSTLKTVLTSVRFLARQGLSLREHRDDAERLEGNLLRLLHLRSNDCPGLNEWLKKRKYVFPDFVNEYFALMGQAVLRGILEKARTAMWFAVIADEVTDVNRHKEMCFAVRWVDKEFKVHEAALGLVELPDTKSATLFGVTRDILSRCSLPVASCIRQAYDGAANMSGVRNGGRH